MKTSRYFAALMTGFGLLLALSAASPDCSAQVTEPIPLNSDVYFISDGDFISAANWDNNMMPSLMPCCGPPPEIQRGNVYGIDDGLSATFSGGTITVLGLRVGSVYKEHNVGATHFGRLTMTGGALLEVIGDAGMGDAFSIGRERAASDEYPKPMGADYNQNTVVDAADYVIWRKTLGSTSDLQADGIDDDIIDALDYEYWRAGYGNVVHGGKIIMTDTSTTVRANGMIIGERTHGLLSVGPGAVVDLRDWVDAVVAPDPPEPAHFGGTADIRIGDYGPAHQTFTEFGADGNGLVDLQGTLNAHSMLFSENGGKGELRLSGFGTVNLNGKLDMTHCDVCVPPTTPARIALLALRSSKVSIIGSSGSFKVGLDPDLMVVDPSLTLPRDIKANNPNSDAIFSFTADMGGVTPIIVVDNTVSGEISGTAFIAGAKLELNLDAYAFTPVSKLTLIDAKPGNVSGQFATPTFLGNIIADVKYDEILTTGNVYLNNFRIAPGAGTGSLASTTVPEPSGLLMMTLMLGLLLFSFSAVAKRQKPRLL
jgi:hypothetical protein